MDRDRVGQYYLAIGGIIAIAGGAAYLFSLIPIASLTGLELSTASAVIDVRATYGGQLIGLGFLEMRFVPCLPGLEEFHTGIRPEMLDQEIGNRLVGHRGLLGSGTWVRGHCTRAAGTGRRERRSRPGPGGILVPGYHVHSKRLYRIDVV